MVKSVTNFLVARQETNQAKKVLFTRPHHHKQAASARPRAGCLQQL